MQLTKLLSKMRLSPIQYMRLRGQRIVPLNLDLFRRMQDLQELDVLIQ